MKVAYFDCFSGISGDMVLGALVDAGVSVASLEAELRKLPVTGWTMSAEKVKRGALAATKVHVTAEGAQKHRHLKHILEMISAAGLSPGVAARATQIFTRLGKAEARIHDVPVEKIHFHEVGAVDAIVDVVGACIGFELLGVERFTCSAVNVGGGSVETAHGTLPVPAPATAELLKGKPTYSTGIARELATPTGAAIVSTLCADFGALPAMRVAAIGYGAGTWELEGQPNVLRLFVGEAAERAAAAPGEESVVVIETNVDDMNPQLYGWLAEQALAAGALDVFAAPVQMKKNRPGQLVTILCAAADTEKLVALLFRETTTLGVRIHETRRRTLARETVPVTTPWGDVRVKVARLDGQVLNVAPEFDDCRRVARERNVPLKQVLAEAAFAFHRKAK